jgi:ADP-ribosylglycohydrolase
MRNPNTALLLYIAMADAYAMAAEFVDPAKHPEHLAEVLRFRRYVRHPYHQDAAGMFTDDTEMSCANAKVLISHPPPYEPIEFAQAWIDEFNRGGRRKGYARRFQAFLESVRDGQDFLDRIRNDSDKNGACMRAVPIGALPKVQDVLEVATLQARITHDTPPALFSARLVALMAHYTLYAAKDFDGLYAYCRLHLPPDDRPFLDSIQAEWEGPVDGKRRPLALETVHAVSHIIRTNCSLSWMLEDAIYLGGDTDSVAAIAWGIASTFHRQEKLKDFFVRDLEPGRDTGSGYLRELSFRLMQAYA